MAVIANITSFTGTEGQELTAADAGWTRDTSSDLGAGEITVDGGGVALGPIGSVQSAAYLRAETPGSRNQVVRATVAHRQGTSDLSHVILARYAGGNYISAQLRRNVGAIRLITRVGSTTSIVESKSYSVASSTQYEIELSVTGVAPNIECVVKVDGVTEITRTLTSSALDAVGKVGIATRAFSAVNSGLNKQFFNFYAEDDTSSGGGDPPQGTVTITDVTPNTTSAEVTYSYNDTDQTGFEYRLDGGTAASIGASPATITGLTAGTTYDLQIRAINAHGSGDWSAISEFTTTAAGNPPATAPANLAAVAQSDTQINVTWAAVSGATGYEIEIDSGSPVDVGNVLLYEHTGLTAETQHSYRVRAYNLDGAGPWSSAVQETTQAAPVASTITVTQPLKNNTGTVRASESGVRVAVLQAADLVSVFEDVGLTTNASGLLSAITDPAIATGQQYHVVIKTADGGVGITGPITAS